MTETFGMVFDAPKTVETKYGKREVMSAKPTQEFWQAWREQKDKLKRMGYSVYKTDRGDWIVNLWSEPGKLPNVAYDKFSVQASYATDSDLSIPAPNGLKYLPYQRAGIAYALARRATLIADPMGLGKTIQAIGVANAMPEAERILVVCPAALRLNWQREFAKWDAHGRLIAVATDVVPSTNVVVTNYDRLAKLHPGLKAVEWDLIILDEAHYLKNADAKRTKLVFGKDGLRGKRWVSLSGTPLMNRPAELWTHCKAYDPNGLGRSWREYHVRYCNGHINYMGHWDISGASHLDELNRLLRERFMIRREKTEVLQELPPKRRQLIAVDPRSDTERALVNREREILNTLEAEYGDVVKALSEPGALPAISELSRIRHETALLKTSYVVEHVLEHIEEEGKCVVFTWHRDVAETIAEQLCRSLGRDAAVVVHGDHTTEERQAAVDMFQRADNPRVLVATMKAMGVGFTLTRADWVVFAELSWTPADIEQAEDRLHRIGQSNPVLSQHLVYDETTDAYMARRLVEKLEVLSHVLK